MMKGIAMMMKSMGINIDPVEVETLFNNCKVWIPQLIDYARAKLDSMDSRLTEIEARLARIESQNDVEARDRLLKGEIVHVSRDTNGLGTSAG